MTPERLVGLACSMLAIATSTEALAQPPPSGPPERPPMAPPAAPPPAAPTAPGPVAAKPTIAVVDTHFVGADPAVGAFVTTALRRAAVKLGYAPIAQESTRAALAKLKTPGPLGPAEVLAVARNANARRGVVANVQAVGGRYSVQVHVASVDGRGPWFAEGTATALDLPDVVEKLLTSALPRPGSSAAPRPVESIPRLRLALQTEGAIGVSGDGFYNHLVGARLDYRFTSSVAGGVYVAYANLKGKDGRVSNVLPLLSIEYRFGFGETESFGIPVRFASGYLANNGPVLRLSGGLGFRVSDGFEVNFDLVAPTFWSSRDETVVSFDLAAELAFLF